MDTRRYIIGKVLEGVNYYYIRHPGDYSNWRGGHFGYWTKKKAKGTVFYSEAPSDWPTGLFYEKPAAAILDLVHLLGATRKPEEWFEQTSRATASHAESIHYGRGYYHLQLIRWLYEMPVSSGKLKSSGRIYYANLDTGEEYLSCDLSIDLTPFDRYNKHPAKVAKQMRKQGGTLQAKVAQFVAMTGKPNVLATAEVLESVHKPTSAMHQLMEDYQERIRIDLEARMRSGEIVGEQTKVNIPSMTCHYADTKKKAMVFNSTYQGQVVVVEIKYIEDRGGYGMTVLLPSLMDKHMFFHPYHHLRDRMLHAPYVTNDLKHYQDQLDKMGVAYPESFKLLLTP